MKLRGYSALLGLAVLAACGPKFASDEGADGSSGAGGDGTSGGAAGNGGGVAGESAGNAGNGGSSGVGAGGSSAPCPTELPSSGAACNRPGVVCEYGDDPRDDCRSSATCGANTRWVTTPASCPPPPVVNCPPTYGDAAGAACTPEGAYCSYDGLACACTNCTDGPVPLCSGDPKWQCDRAHDDPDCPRARPSAGTACAIQGKLCSYECGEGNGRVCDRGVWQPADGGPCAISTRHAKRDVHYVAPDELDKLAQQALGLKLATYEYVDPALGQGRRLGFMIEDAPEVPAVDRERRMVDVYGYASMLLAGMQSQQRRIAALERELATLKRELGSRGNGSRAAVPKAPRRATLPPHE